MGPLSKWIVSGSAEKLEWYESPGWSRRSIQVRATHLNVETTALTAGQAHDNVVEALTSAGWRNINLTGINQEV